MKNSKWYLINIKNKTLGKISKFIINLIKIKKILNKNNFNKILIFNEKKIKFFKKKYKKKYVYKHTGYIGKLKKINFLKLYKKNIKELIKNSIFKMIKNNKIKKIIKKKIKFLKNNKDIKFLKSKILYF